jgi:hypothetical protein
VFDLGSERPARPSWAILARDTSPRVGSQPPADHFALSPLALAKRARASLFGGQAEPDLACEKLAGDGARAGTVKLPRALLPRPNPWPTYTPSPPPSQSSSPLHTLLPWSHRRRGKLRCRRGFGVPRASSPSPRCGSASRRRGSLAGCGDSVFFLLFSGEVVCLWICRVVCFPVQICYFLFPSICFEHLVHPLRLTRGEINFSPFPLYTVRCLALIYELFVCVCYGGDKSWSY